ncbi:hypothetical protein LMED105_04637 [Limnobacter sp. MED105]|nr:hypothetical protein LMED105_04637 [Limnobacter sp. MED105]
MTEVLELELVQCGNNAIGVMPFVKYAKGKDENWIVWIQILHAMVTTFVDIDDVVTE